MKKAFTLVEVMIVIAIIGLIAAILIPNLHKAKQLSELKKTHPSLDYAQLQELYTLRLKDPNAELPVTSGSIDFPKQDKPGQPMEKVYTGIIVDKMMIYNKAGNMLPTIVVVETNYYSVTEKEYIQSVVGTPPTFNKK
jgi:prepilin-type N-terminal cleavage/methylation domain-containing protein